MRRIIVAIICITILEAIALFQGINGMQLRIVIALVAGSAGLAVPAHTIFKRKNKQGGI